MPDRSRWGRPVSEPRLDLHNSNVEQVAAETGQCATIDLRNGRICRLPAMHAGGCTFEPANPRSGKDGPRHGAAR